MIDELPLKSATTSATVNSASSYTGLQMSMKLSHNTNVPFVELPIPEVEFNVKFYGKVPLTSGALPNTIWSSS